MRKGRDRATPPRSREARITTPARRRAPGGDAAQAFASRLSTYSQFTSRSRKFVR